jgi:hypothetical protein
MTTPRYGRLFWVALPVGAAIMGFGAVGLLRDTSLTAAADVARWLVGADIAHDFVLAPIAALIGAAVARLLPRWCRAPVEAGLIASGVLLIVVFPALRGYGRDTVPDNVSVDPLDYTTATLTALGVVWVAAAGWLLIRIVRRRETRPARQS